MRKYILFLFGVLGALAVWLSASPCMADSRDCLKAIQKSIDDADLPAFERLVNLDDILDEGLSVFVREMGREENSRRLPPMINLLVASLSGVQGKLTRPPVIQEIGAFIRNGISSGAFAGKPAKQEESKGLIASLFENASMGRKEIILIQPEKAVQGGAEAGFFVHDYGNGNDYPVMGFFVEEEGGQCLAQVRNFEDIFSQILAESLR